MSGQAFLEGLLNGVLTQSQQRFENELQARRLQLSQEQEANQGQYLQALSKAATMRAQNAGDKTFKYLSALGAIETRVGKLRGEIATQKGLLPDQQDPGRIQRLQQEADHWESLSSLLFQKSMVGVLAGEDQGQGQDQQGHGGAEYPNAPGGGYGDMGQGGGGEEPGGPEGDIPGGGEGDTFSTPGGLGKAPSGGSAPGNATPNATVPRGTAPPPGGGRVLPQALSPEQAKGLSARTSDAEKYSESEVGKTALESELFDKQIPFTLSPHIEKGHLRGGTGPDAGEEVDKEAGYEFRNFKGDPITEADILKDPKVLDDTLDAILQANPGYQNPAQLAMFERDVLSKVNPGLVTAAQAAANPTLAARAQAQSKVAEIRAFLHGTGGPEFQAQQQGRAAAAENPMVNAGALLQESTKGFIDWTGFKEHGKEAEFVAQKLDQAISKGQIDLTDPSVMATLEGLADKAFQAGGPEARPEEKGFRALRAPLSKLGFGPGGFGSQAPTESLGTQIGKAAEGVSGTINSFVGRLRGFAGKPAATPPAKPVGAGGANVQGMAARAALAAGAIGAPEDVAAANKAFGTVTQKTKDKAADAVSDVKASFGRMTEDEKTKTQSAWKAKRGVWKGYGVKEATLKDMNEAVGLDRNDGLGGKGGGAVGMTTALTLASLGAGAAPEEKASSTLEGLKKIAQEEGPSRNEKLDQTLNQLDDQLKEHPELKDQLKPQWAAFRDENMDLTDRSLVREIDQRLGVDIAEPKTESEELFPGEAKKKNTDQFRYEVENLAEPKKVEMSPRGIRAYDLVKALGNAHGKMSPRQEKANIADLRDELQFLRMDQPQVISLLARWRAMDRKLPSNEKKDFEEVGRTLFAFLER